ncbi:TPA: Dcm methylase [Enterobacter hormaechei]
MKKIALFLFDRTGIMAQPWKDAGYECWLFDGQHPDGVTFEDGLYKVGMWFYHDKLQEHAEYIAGLVEHGKVHIVVSFAECTDLTCTGARWWADKAKIDPLFQHKAVALAQLVELVSFEVGCRRWMLENPSISKLNTMWRRPDYVFDPYMYGGYLPEDDVHPLYPANLPPRDAYPKTTGIWVGRKFVMPERKPVEPMPGNFHQVTKLGGKTLKTKNIRSCTPRGFAAAVYEANK